MFTNIKKIVSYILYVLSIAIISTLLIRFIKRMTTLNDTMELIMMVGVICIVTLTFTEFAIKLNLFSSKKHNPPS
jgi:hypothetical protein